MSTRFLLRRLLAFPIFGIFLIASVSMAPAQADTADLPAPGTTAWQTVAPGVTRIAAHITNAAGADETLWLYSPANPPAGKLPCVFIAPAGTALIYGMKLSPGDTPEHIPYVQAGYLVVAYSLDGDLSDSEHMTDKQVLEANKAFYDAHFGLTDSEAALDYALKTIPNIDPQRCYTAGHSSAGTVSLLFAEHEPRLAGCIAYAPPTDLQMQAMRGRPAILTELNVYIPGYLDLFQRASPINGVASLRCPTFLFHADDDTNVDGTYVQTFVTALKQTNPNVTYKTVPTGGHFDAMIQQGVPAAIQWLAALPSPNAPN